MRSSMFGRRRNPVRALEAEIEGLRQRERALRERAEAATAEATAAAEALRQHLCAGDLDDAKGLARAEDAARVAADRRAALDGAVQAVGEQIAAREAELA